MYTHSLRLSSTQEARPLPEWLGTYLAICCLLFASLANGPVRAEPPVTVAVVYPEVREPYLGVFMEIIRGIEAEIGRPVTLYPLRDEPGLADAITARIKAAGNDVAISLGHAGLTVAKPLATAMPVVVGAVLAATEQETQGLAGISLTPDPEALFEHLKQLVPDVKEVTVIYDPSRKSWEISRALAAAKARGLTLNAQPAANLHLSAELYRNVLVDMRNDSIAIWLPRDNAVMDEATLLPVLLKQAWEKNFVVFSSNLDHVRKGALFSLYPDNFGMGRSLGSMALERANAKPGHPTNFEPLRNLRVAVNLRTAEHLGLNLAGKRKFDLTFPSSP